MTRYAAITIVLFAAGATGLTQVADNKPFQASGQFTAKDAKDPQRKGYLQAHVVKLKAGKSYTIDMVSNQVDSFLRLQDPKGKLLEEDDDSGGNTNARIVFNCPRDGDYKILCTTFSENQLGAYTLTVKLTGAAAIAVTGHTKLVGQPAPDFRTDFAVRGKAGKLSALRGQVVLVNFCDIRSSSCAALVPTLNRWHKEYQPQGLAIVGITFYASDIGQALGFDAKSGKVVTAKKADRASDQALLRAYAAQQRIEYALAALAKDAALQAHDVYLVNGIPQSVLIDRKGIVRLIDVGGAKSSANLEKEITKLLAEK